MRKISYLLVLLFVISACSKQEAPFNKQAGEEYFPESKKGSKWEYFYILTTPKGAQQGKLIMQIDEENMNGMRYYKQTSFMSNLPGAKPQVSYSRRMNDGIYKIDVGSTSEYLLIPFPMKVGKTWTVKTQSKQITSVAEKIETIEYLKQTYKNCLKVTYHGNTGTTSIDGYTYFAPNVGEVLSEMKMGDIKFQYALDKHTL